MRVRTGIVGVGLGVASIVGCIWGVSEGIHEQHIIDSVEACTLPRYAGRTVCKEMLVPRNGVIHDKNIQEIEYALSAVAGVGAVVTLAMSMDVLRQDETRAMQAQIKSGAPQS